MPGCAKVGQKVVIIGYDIAGGNYSPPLIRGGDGKAKEGEEKMFALAGLYGDNNNHLNTVEEGGPQLGPEKSLLWRSGNL